jgi:hypothetical protein
VGFTGTTIDEFSYVCSSAYWEDKSGKPFTSRHSVVESQIISIVDGLINTKTKKFISKEARETAKAEKAEKRRLSKRAWCDGCPFGTHKKKCDHMKSYEEEYGIFACTNKGWWEWNWCQNAERIVEDEKKLFLGHFNCKLTGERCPYNKESSVVKGEFFLIKDIDGNHFTTCKDYKKDI